MIETHDRYLGLADLKAKKQLELQTDLLDLCFSLMVLMLPHAFPGCLKNLGFGIAK